MAASSTFPRLFPSFTHLFHRSKQFYQTHRSTINCLLAGNSLYYASSYLYTASSLYRTNNTHTVQCCGIVGYLGDEPALQYLMEGILMLQNRGYDSCGITTLNANNELVTTKYSSHGTTSDCIESLQKMVPSIHENHYVGIGHTRWATHGSKTDANAHPHHDYKNRISLIHNGTINNFYQLKKKLKSRNIPFVSETDTEVIANLIGSYMDEGETVEAACSSAIKELEGTWGLCVLPAEREHRIIAARNGSPVLIGSSPAGTIFISSEAVALSQFTNEYISLEDGEIAVLKRNGGDQLCGTKTKICEKLNESELSCAPHTHWTIKEIYEQPQSLMRAMNYGGRLLFTERRVKLGGLDVNELKLQNIRHMVLSGCGTSYHAALFGEHIFQWLNIFDFCKAKDAAELLPQCLPRQNGGLILLSQSGETLDTIRCSHIASEMGVTQLAIVNTVGSLLARLAGCGVYLNAGREVAVASTKSFSSQACVLSLVAIWFAQHNTETANLERCHVLLDAIQRLPVCVNQCLQSQEECKKVANDVLVGSTSLFVLGSSAGYPIALEGALKLKEIAYIHAEGFAGGSLKHGPFALIDEEKNTPVILIILQDEKKLVLMNAAQQLKCRGACIICISSIIGIENEISVDYLLHVPENGPMTAVLCNIILQLLAYQTAVAKNINPDKPRGLAKTVTVY